MASTDPEYSNQKEKVEKLRGKVEKNIPETELDIALEKRQQ